MCKKVIVKGDLRIGKSAAFKEKVIIKFYHIDCAFIMFHSSRKIYNVITCTDDVRGFHLLSNDDKDRLSNCISSMEPVMEKIIQSETSKRPMPTKNSSQDTNTRKNTYRRTVKLKPNDSPTINILFTNADQFTNSKKNELERRISVEKPVIIAICEVKSKNGKLRELIEYDIEGFNMYHCNLDKENGRGIAVYVHSSVDKSIIQVKTDIKFEEYCLLDIKLRGADMMLFGCFYRSPTLSEFSDENNAKLNELLKSVCTKKYSHICLVGDFNFKKINWVNVSTNEPTVGMESKFLETINDCFLYQHVTEPTRIRGNTEPSLLDLILTDEEFQVPNVRHLSPLGASDHCLISFKYNCYIETVSKPDKYLYHKADYEGMRSNLRESNWSETSTALIHEKSIEEGWGIIKDKFMELRNKFVPLQAGGRATWKSKGSIPIDRDIQSTIRKKHQLHRRWINARADVKEALRLEYVRARNKVKTLVRQAKKKVERDISRDAKKNPKKFWSYVRRKMKTRANISPLLENPEDPDSLKYTDAEKAEILQRQFCSVFVREPGGEIPKINSATVKTTMNEPTITEKVVADEIKLINKNKSCGPDAIEVMMLHELIDFVAKPITALLKMSFTSGILPQDWLTATVTPVYKKGNHNKAENYRPISLTSIICKVMESIIKKDIVKYFNDNKFFTDVQHGFIAGRSTTTQLLKFIDQCLQTCVKGGVVDTIYLDFAKAFDTVPHKRLIGKLRSYGIKDKTLNWIQAFLSNRSQVVRVNGVTSDAAAVGSGIPQGSVLGPILFVIYINDLPREVSSSTLLFADDTKIYRWIKSIHDSLHLQNDLDRLVEWSKKWLLEFNESKCHVLSLGKVENIIHAHNYKMNGVKLEHVFEEKDLGITVDSELRFGEHITAKVKKANSMAGVIRRSFSYLDPAQFKTLYVAFVRPHLEYGNSIWSPYLRKYVNAVEQVQVRATKSVDGFNELTYEERLRKVGLPTLAHRRKRGDMIEVFKHVNVYDKAALSTSFRLKNRPSRAHKFQLMRNEAADGTRGPQRNSFYYRTVTTWNEFPRSVVEAETVDAFKRNMDEHWSDDPGIFTFDAKPYHHQNE